jgi:hypothetical protein
MNIIRKYLNPFGIILGFFFGLVIMATPVFSQGQNFGTGTSSSIVGGSPTQWINCLTQTTTPCKRDSHQVTFNISNTGTVATLTAGNCSASDIGKNVFGINSVGAGSTNSFSATNNVTVTSCTPGTSFTIAGGSGTNNLSGSTGWIGTDDSPAINACIASAIAVQGKCYLPGATTAYYLKSGLTLVNQNTPFILGGDTMDTTRLVFPPFGITANIIQVQDTAATIENISIDNGALASVVCTNIGFLDNFQYTYRVRFSNWNCGAGGGYPCFDFTTDGIQASEIESFSCYDAVLDGATDMTFIRPNLHASHTGFHNFDTNTIIVGGTLVGGTNAELSDVQAAVFGSIWMIGVAKDVTGTGAHVVETVSGSNTYISNSMVGGGKNCDATPTNMTGINIVSGATVYITQSWICSSGSGVGVANAGTFVDQGGVTYPQIGASTYSGAGAANGKSVLSGAAYTNSTTGFTNVVGGSGQTFAWSVGVNQFLSVSCHLYYQAAATGGLNIEFTGPAAPTFVTYGLNDPNSATAFNSAVATAFGTSIGQAVTTATTNFDATVSFTMQNGATAGTVNLLAKSSAAANLTIQPGSYCQSQ